MEKLFLMLASDEQRKELQEQEVILAPTLGRKPIDPSLKKNINIKIRKETKRKIVEIAKITEDYGDVVESVVDFYLENRGKPGIKERRIRDDDSSDDRKD